MGKYWNRLVECFEPFAGRHPTFSDYAAMLALMGPWLGFLFGLSGWLMLALGVTGVLPGIVLWQAADRVKTREMDERYAQFMALWDDWQRQNDEALYERGREAGRLEAMAGDDPDGPRG